jgi:cell division protein FtsL
MKGKQDEAYRLWKKALAIDDGDYKDNVIHSILSYDIEHGHVEKVCEHLDEIIHIKDSMLNKLKNDTIKDLQFRFDHEVSMRKQEQITSYWRIGGLVTLVIILLFIIYAIWEWDKMKDEKHCVQMQINDYISQIRELKASNKDVNKAIEELNKKIRNKLEELSPDLLQGQIYYEQILNGEIKTICNWTNRDEKLFVDYYKAIDYRTVHRIMSIKRKEPLTTHRLFYLLLKEMGKSDSQIQCLFSISDNGMKVLRSRTKEIK